MNVRGAAMARRRPANGTDTSGQYIVMPQPDDGALWRRARRGNETAFGTLFERHARAIHSYCFRRTADWALAEDLTSATFLESWRHRARVELAPHEVLPWLYGVASNLIRNSARSRRRYAAAIARIPREAATSEHADAATERVASQQRVRELLRSLQQLPVGELETLVLVCWQGLTHNEAAYVLGVPEATVRTRLFRARNRLATAEAPEHAVAVPIQDEGGS